MLGRYKLELTRISTVLIPLLAAFTLVAFIISHDSMNNKYHLTDFYIQNILTALETFIGNCINQFVENIIL